MTQPRWRYVALVAVGGTLGTAARALLGRALPDGSVPWSTLVANLGGAFLFGVLLEFLALVSTDGVPHRGWRLFLGTGFLGGLTTYSALAVGTDAVARAGRPGLALGYAAGTVVGGLVACWLGGEAATYGVRLAGGPGGEPDLREVES